VSRKDFFQKSLITKSANKVSRRVEMNTKCSLSVTKSANKVSRRVEMNTKCSLSVKQKLDVSRWKLCFHLSSTFGFASLEQAMNASLHLQANEVSELSDESFALIFIRPLCGLIDEGNPSSPYLCLCKAKDWWRWMLRFIYKRM